MVNRSDYKSNTPNGVGDKFSSKKEEEKLVNQDKIMEKWWLEFDDETLNELIENAEKNNRNIEIARQNLIKSRYAITFATMGIFPTGGVGYNYYMFKNPLFGPGIDLNLFQAGFDAQWELDIWGKTLDKRSAAKFRSLKIMQNHSNVLLSLYGEISKNYIQLRKYQSLYKNTEKRLDIYKKILDFKEKAFNVGVIQKTEFLEAKLLIENESMKLKDIDTQIKTLIYQLSFLTGDLPESLYDKLKIETKDFKDYKTEVVPIGLRSDLLNRRPDIKMAEYELDALIDDASVRSKEFLPSFQFSGSFMFSAKNAIGAFTGPLVTTMNLGPKFSILQLPSLITQYKMSKVDAKIAMLEYEQVILSALKDTEVALITYLNNLKSEYSGQNYLNISLEIYNNKKEMHKAGDTNALDFLKSEIDFLTAKDLFLNSKEKTLIALIALHKELGGGFDRDVETDGNEVRYVDRKNDDLEKYKENLGKLNQNDNILNDDKVVKN